MKLPTFQVWVNCIFLTTKWSREGQAKILPWIWLSSSKCIRLIMFQSNNLVQQNIRCFKITVDDRFFSFMEKRKAFCSTICYLHTDGPGKRKQNSCDSQKASKIMLRGLIKKFLNKQKLQTSSYLLCRRRYSSQSWYLNEINKFIYDA